MSQISMPMRILLIGAVVFLAAWFTILKPGGAEEVIPPVQPANVAPAATATPGGPAAAAEDTAVAATAIPADVLAKLPKGVAEALGERKTIVFGVFADKATKWRPMADDDRYVRNALKKTNRYDGEVYAKNISLPELSRYSALVNDLGVTQSPSVVVIDANLKGTVLTGYVDRIAINQAIADARRTSIDPYIADAYLQWANEFCGRYEARVQRWSQPTIPGQKALTAAIERMRVTMVTYRQTLKRKPAPAKYKRFKAALAADIADSADAYAAAKKASKAGKSVARINEVLYDRYDYDVASKLDKVADEFGVTGCAWKRRS